MKIAVVGAGAMGSIFGARFHQAGHETVLVDVVQPLVDTINADGVTVVRGDDETVTRVPATTDPASVGPVDIVVFFTKCYHTSSAAESARPLVGPDTVVASLQNGWGNGDVLAAAYPPGQVVLGVTYNSGLLQGPGRVLHPAEQPTLVGSFSDGGDGAARLAEALESAGLAATVASPVRPEIWKKLILNAASLPASALTGMTAGALGTCDDMLDLVSETTREAVAVAQALGYDIDFDERIGDDPGAGGEGGPDEGVDAAGRRGRAAHRDRRDQRRCRQGRRRGGCCGAHQPRAHAADQGLGDAERARMSTSLTYHGAASYEIVSPTHTILIDPFLTGNPLAPCGPDDLRTPDVILVSHAAVDHYGDAPAVAKRTGAPVICDAAVRAKLIDDGVSPDQITPTTWGIVVEVAGIVVRPVECHHWSMATLSDGRTVVGNPIAFIVETEPGVRIYHYGDTCIFDMRLIGELYRPTVGLLGCTLPRELSYLIPGPGTFLTGEMDPDEAARCGGDARPRARRCLPLPRRRTRTSIASSSSSQATTRPETRRVVAPLVGETLVVEPGNHWIEGKA